MRIKNRIAALLVLTREVFYRTFDNRRQIASYLGLAPNAFSERRHGSRSARQSRRQPLEPRCFHTAADPEFLR